MEALLEPLSEVGARAWDFWIILDAWQVKVPHSSNGSPVVSWKGSNLDDLPRSLPLFYHKHFERTQLPAGIFCLPDIPVPSSLCPVSLSMHSSAVLSPRMFP